MALDEGDGLVCRSAGAPRFPRPDAPRHRPHPARADPGRAAALARRDVDLCANVSPGAAYFQDPDGHGYVYHAAGSYGPGRKPVDDPASAALKKGIAGDKAMTDRFCAEIVEERAPALAMMWLSEPDYTGHHSPLGSPQHRARDRRRRRQCVRQVFETVRRLDPSGEDILFITGSDHGMETIGEAIDLDGLLIAAGLKEGPGSRDVVVAPNGTAATIYFADAARDRVARRRAISSPRENWVGEVFAGDRLAAVGLPTDTRDAGRGDAGRRRPGQPARRARAIARSSHDPADNESKIGFGQHGGLGANEQRPFLIARGRRVRARAAARGRPR